MLLVGYPNHPFACSFLVHHLACRKGLQSRKTRWKEPDDLEYVSHESERGFSDDASLMKRSSGENVVEVPMVLDFEPASVISLEACDFACDSFSISQAILEYKNPPPLHFDLLHNLVKSTTPFSRLAALAQQQQGSPEDVRFNKENIKAILQIIFVFADFHCWSNGAGHG